VGHGSGLGLYVTQEIVHQHGGCIGVESRPGEHTRFLIALPEEPLPATGGRPADQPKKSS
jgi:signal transduction histidine kinase